MLLNGSAKENRSHQEWKGGKLRLAWSPSLHLTRPVILALWIFPFWRAVKSGPWGMTDMIREECGTQEIAATTGRASRRLLVVLLVTISSSPISNMVGLSADQKYLFAPPTEGSLGNRANFLLG